MYSGFLRGFIDPSTLVDPVNARVPFDGTQTNISLFDAGLYTYTDTQDPTRFPLKFQNYSVCGEFLSGSSGYNLTVAMAQTQAPATDLYVNTSKAALKSLTKNLTSTTILHETLHSVTGKTDSELYNALTGLKLPAGPTNLINVALDNFGCRPN
jgi:hypothetical protein